MYYHEHFLLVKMNQKEIERKAKHHWKFIKRSSQEKINKQSVNESYSCCPASSN